MAGWLQQGGKVHINNLNDAMLVAFLSRLGFATSAGKLGQVCHPGGDLFAMPHSDLGPHLCRRTRIE